MISSGIKRGLAVSAVSALAVVGLPQMASAQTVAQGLTNDLVLYSQYSGGATTLNDGVDNTVTLFAGTSATIGGTTVNSVQFQYFSTAAGDWVDIATVVAVDGVATTQWTPTGNLADITDVRARALSNANVELDTDTNAVTVSNAAGVRAAHLAGALRSEVGIGPDGEIVVRGTTTDSAANTDVSALGPEVAGADGVTTVGTPNGSGVSNFVSVVPVGTPGVDNNTADANDEIVVGVEVTGSDDVNAYTAYQQIVTAANVSPTTASVQSGGANNVSTYTITVTDQKGQPVQGLDVYESNAAGAADATANGGTVDANGNYVAGDGGETDVDGKFVGALQESDIDNADDQDGNPNNNSQTAYFVVDVNQNGTYDNGVDYRFQVTQTENAATPTTIEITSAKGNAIDDDESTQVTLLVKDQNGLPIQGATPVVRVTRVNNDVPANDPNKTVVTTPAVAATGADGKTSFTLTGLNDTWADYTVEAYINNNGTPQPDAGDAIATPVEIVSNTSEVVWDSGSDAQALNGTTTTLTGMLVQDDTDTPLPGRTIAIDYAAADNSVLAAQAQQPAGTTRGSDTTASATTDANGAFGVAVTDPATPAGQELGSDVTAQAPGLESAGDQTDAVIELDFIRSVTPASVEIINPGNGQSDGLAPGLAAADDGNPMPGGLAVGYVQAFNSDGIQLEDVDVEITADEGEFLDFENPFEDPEVGGLAGEWNTVGKTITVNTGDSGEGDFALNIERNEGFDDDGLVDDNLSATAGASTDTHDFTWSTNGDPLNQNEDTPFEVELSEDQESSVLPKARAGDAFGGSGQVVDYDVRTWDQFGNPTSQDIDVSDNTPLADFNDSGESEFELFQPAISAFAETGVNQVIEVELEGATRFTYADDPENSEFDPADPFNFITFSSVELQETVDAINWYDVDFAASTFTLDNQGPEVVPVGTTVTEVLTAIDQEGQPIEGMEAQFLRGGPGPDDSDTNWFADTDADGKAFYDFVGGSKGEATVTAVLFADDGTRLGRVGPDTVTFGGQKTNIGLKVTGKSKGKMDKITANANENGAGLTAKLFKNGKRVKTATLKDNGNFTFSVKDTNGTKKTKYVVRVAKTPTTNKAAGTVRIK